MPEQKNKRAELLFIIWPLTQVEPTPLLNGLEANLIMDGRPDFKGEIMCKPDKKSNDL